MLKHNLVLFFRNIKKNQSSFLINTIGLSTGLACVLLIFLWVNDELNVDGFHKNDDHLVQVMKNNPRANGITTSPSTPGRLAQSIKEEFPEVTHAIPVIEGAYSNKAVITHNEKRIKAVEQYTESDFFKVFSYPLLDGDKEQILEAKNAVVISEEIAMKLFGTTKNLIGKMVEWNREDFVGKYVISGVFEKLPSNSSIQFDLLFNYELYVDQHPWIQEWRNSDPSTYLVLREGIEMDQFNTKLNGFIKSKYEASESTLFIRKYSDKYLYNTYADGVLKGGRIDYVKLFSSVALFILCIACINFINLSTARASKRLNEIGIKKVLGSSRKRVVSQHLIESQLLSFFSFLLAVFLVVLVLPYFNQITGKNLSIEFNSIGILVALSIIGITGFLSGAYPAIYLSGFQPSQILKGKLKASRNTFFARKALVVTQFSLSIILIVAVLVVQDQMEYIQNKNLGYQRDNVIQFEAPSSAGTSVETFLSELKKIAGVKNATNYSHNLIGDHGELSGIDWEGRAPEESVNFGNLEVGYDFLETLGIEIVSGRSFSRDFNVDQQIIFNEEAIKAMGLEDPIGKTIRLFGQEREIIGVAKNFHFESLYEKVGPSMFLVDPNARGIMVSIAAGSEMSTLAQIEKVYEKFGKNLAFEFTFLDDSYNAIYASEKRVSVLSGYAAAMAILISCLGLFGLAIFTAELRRKEIGIRKVLGQSAAQVTMMLSGQFAKLVLVSVCVALPMAYILTNNWLSGFAYRIPLRAWYFLGAGLAALVVALFTVGSQAIQAANRNPVNALRDE
ncbi:ABC transporter permease [Ulvibacterium sp.]|uniref:ABC transporter permease n=1 Tax=Ulvibacterium sp. TaxID=2665914 RepID=UPI003BABD934